MKTAEILQKGIKGDGQAIIIAGPCSAESEKQVLQTATALAAGGYTSLFRAGIWKPRTRPGGFEGVGEKGLPWLQRVQLETGLQATTEVATGKHVYEALKYGINHLWIGARTTVNPFATQEVADALRGANVTVFVKNPINPDPKLWLGALERIKKAGITQVAAIHRGFSGFEQSFYRNTPQWQLPLEIKKQLPGLPVICDPSHIAGDSYLVPGLARKALLLGMDGLMVEVHPKPARAKSDGKQQLTPAFFNRMMRQLVNNLPSNKGQGATILEELRSAVDVLDKNLISTLSQRMQLAEEIAGIKSQSNMDTLQPQRWQHVVSNAISRAGEKGLRAGFIQKLFEEIHLESLSIQRSTKTNPYKKSGIPTIFEA